MRRKIELWGTRRRVNPRLSECNLSERKEIDLNPSFIFRRSGRKVGRRNHDQLPRSAAGAGQASIAGVGGEIAAVVGVGRDEASSPRQQEPSVFFGDGSFPALVHSAKNTTVMRATVSSSEQTVDPSAAAGFKKSSVPLEIELETKAA
ncbi:hypothetical protein KSP40_PGU013684 [Platanthera guangdongensis]|uniref:Uncharacterized protein n=1 Tax=Platanthera guangdongensis TaxID=2320717 RepID=A0ABR2N4Z5_9ASPA